MITLDELKQLAQTDEQLDQRKQDIYCPVCERKRSQIISAFDHIQIRDCEGLVGKKHTLFFDSKGKILWAVEHRDGTVDWRVKFDYARTEGVTPQLRAWDNPRRKGGRRKGGSGWTEYVNSEEDE